MWVRDEIRRVASKGVQELSESDTKDLFERVEKAFARNGRTPLWERLTASAGRQNAYGWREIGRFVDGALILLVDDPQGHCAFRFDTAAALQGVLEETSGFEFYATDDALTFLLAFNHHDFVIGAGRAEAWIRSLPE